MGTTPGMMLTNAPAVPLGEKSVHHHGRQCTVRSLSLPLQGILTMFKAIAVSMVLMVPSLAMANAKCDAHPKSEWKSEADARAKFEGDGYKISKFKVSGNCYEIYGFNKDGKKAEIYFDTKTLAIVKSEIG
jgi:hypothetical protein